MEELQNGCEKLLQIAEELKCRSVSIPAISCGIFYDRKAGIPMTKIFSTMVESIFNYDFQETSSLEVVRFVGKNDIWKGFRKALSAVTMGPKL